MSSLVLKAPFTVNNPALTQLPSTDFENLKSYSLESDAWAHWIFDDAQPLTDKVNSRALTLQGSAPTYQSGYLTTQGYANALNLGLTVPTAGTFCTVVKKRAGSILGLNGQSPAEPWGINVFTDAGSNNLRAFVAKGQINQVSAITPVDLSAANVGDWLFLACAFDFSGSRPFAIYAGGIGSDEVNASDSPDASIIEIHLGNAAYNSPSYIGNDDFAELIFFEGKKSIAELDTIYSASVERMALNGISVYQP